MSFPYTFKINEVDFSDIITKYGYQTAYEPIYSDIVTTLDKVDHTSIVRWKSGLTIPVRPLERVRLMQLTAALTAGIPFITFTSLQRGEDLTAYMKMDDYTSELVLQNASRLLLGGTQLTFVEL